MKNSDNIGGNYKRTFRYADGDIEKGLVEKIRYLKLIGIFQINLG